MDIICAICTDPMRSTEEDIKVTHCGHMFHGRCMNEWLEKPSPHPTCPECRSRCKPKTIVSVFLNLEKTAVPPVSADAKAISQMDEHLMKLATENSRQEEELRQKDLLLKSNKESIVYLNSIIRDLWKALNIGQLKPDSKVFSSPTSQTADSFKFINFSFPPPPFEKKNSLDSSTPPQNVSVASTSSSTSNLVPTHFSYPPLINNKTSSSKPLQDITCSHMVNSRQAVAAEPPLQPPPIRQKKKVDQCPNRFCSETILARMYCGEHKKCNDECRNAPTELQLVKFFENGSMYCEKCVDLNCDLCFCDLYGTCVQKDGSFYHEECFPCNLCGLPLSQTGEMLQKKSKQYCSYCLRCTYCEMDLTGKLYTFEGNYPCCQNCNQRH